VAVLSAGRIDAVRGLGRVKEALPPESIAHLSGSTAIGHTRYGTAGGKGLQNVQPFSLEIPHIGPVAIAHNGNLTNAIELRERLTANGRQFQSSSDTEVILHLMAEASSLVREPSELLATALRQVSGSYSVVVLFPDCVVAARDPHGNRPLMIGRRDGAVIVTSEQCGWDSFHVYHFDDVPAGSLVKVDLDGTVHRAARLLDESIAAPCLMELLYFARPDSTVFGVPVSAFRQRLGARIAERHPVEADLVVPLMSSGLDYACGFAERLGLKLSIALIKNPSAPRVFMQPEQQERFQGTLEKHALIRSQIADKRIVFIDDSIVRGTTLQQIIPLCFPDLAVGRSGASEVHVRIAAPPLVGPCHYGISTPTSQELAVNRYGGYSGVGPVDPVQAAMSVQRNINATSMGFGTFEDVAAALNMSTGEFCTACFTNVYDRIPVEQRLIQLELPRLEQQERSAGT